MFGCPVRVGVGVEAQSPCRVWWDQVHQVARHTWVPGAVCRLPDAQAVTLATAELGHGRVPVLVDMRRLAGIDRDARHHFSQPTDVVTAVALWVDSAVSRIIGRVMVGLLDTVPARTFTDEPSAWTWLTASTDPYR